jgi:hypothetical protein
VLFTRDCAQIVPTACPIAHLFGQKIASTSVDTPGKCEPPVRIELYSAILIRGLKPVSAAKAHHGK